MNRINLNILASIAGFSRKAYNKLFDTIYPIIWHYYSIRIKNKEDAKDITQEACIKIFNNIRGYKSEKGSFLTWMYNIIKNNLIDFFRKKSIAITDINPDILAGTETPINNIIKKEEESKIKNFLNKLTIREKEIIEMRYFFYMKNKEIALSLKINEKTVSSIIFKATGKIKELLDNNGH